MTKIGGCEIWVPRVHLNGSSYEELMTQLSTVTEALGFALDALAQATPHGRDYYMQGDAIGPARADHAGRTGRLKSVLTEIELIAAGVYQQREKGTG